MPDRRLELRCADCGCAGELTSRDSLQKPPEAARNREGDAGMIRNTKYYE
jgi:hypothetical protein